MFTPHQSAYFAHWLTQSGRIENRVSQTMASARVDMNPHQVEAACFALKSPLAKGVLLADEVGLGKTIEASLVIVQKWAEGKRNILLVTPASLRKQWNQELADKFELPSIIIDSKIAKEQKQDGRVNPFVQDEQIVICSYEFVAAQKAYIGLIDWHLVVFDEAHRLRNIYQSKGSLRAKAVVKATRHAELRVLLSATPLQNHLLELYGLAQVIDEHYFGDTKSFKALYVNRQKNKEALEDLKQRIKPLCHRTLRKQVQQEGGINFTNRYSLTQDFTPTDAEWELYKKLSDYLQQPDLQAISHQARHLVSIGIRKILASSSFAVAETLKGVIARLKKQQLLDEDAITDLEEADDWLDRFDEEAAQDKGFKQAKLAEEIAQLSEYQQLAASITRNAKGDALLIVLKKALDTTVELGGQRKAVVFTESCRTQEYLDELLQNNGYAGRTVQLNGSNNDPRSKQIYKDWLERHQGSARISRSRTADMKAALVEYFKSDAADILISTEAGGEGINLQFCSVLINYDLPWNPQKVEQRIGRVHRYGQKNDVVVVNFVNRKNPADQRVFQLLSEKLKLFEGVFGASDEILGAIESSIDVEKRIYEIYQKCRTDLEIEEEFDQLQKDMEGALQVREEIARQHLFSHFDRDVVATLKNSRDRSQDFLKGYEQVLLDLARAELPEADFNRNHFFYKGQRYDLNWVLAQEHDSEFFRLQATEHYLAWELVHKAKSRHLQAAHLQFSYSALEGGQFAALRPLIGQSGVLQAVNLTFKYAKTRENHLLVLARSETGTVLTQEDAEHLLFVPASVTQEPAATDTSALAPLLNEAVAAKKLETQEQLEKYFEQENNKLERWAEDRRQTLFITVEELDAEIKALKKEARQLASTAEKVQAKKALRKLERKRDDALSEYREAIKKIEREEDSLLDDISAKLELETRIETLFSIRWTLNR
jgi:ERCC4-related helicase